MSRLGFKRWMSDITKLYQLPDDKKYYQQLLRTTKTSSSCLRKELFGCRKCDMFDECKIKGKKKMLKFNKNGTDIMRDILDLKKHCDVDSKGDWHIKEKNGDSKDTGTASDKS